MGPDEDGEELRFVRCPRALLEEHDGGIPPEHPDAAALAAWAGVTAYYLDRGEAGLALHLAGDELSAIGHDVLDLWLIRRDERAEEERKRREQKHGG